MEQLKNSEGKDDISVSREKKKTPANPGNPLIVSGIAGVILTSLYFVIVRDCNFWEHTCSAVEATMHLRIIIAQTLYFLITSLALLFGGNLLRRKKSLGGLFFLVALSFILVSVLIPAGIFFPQYQSSAGNFGSSLFGAAVGSALLGSILLAGVPAVGTLIFYLGILFAIFRFPKFSSELGMHQIFRKLPLFVFSISLLIVLIKIAVIPVQSPHPENPSQEVSAWPKNASKQMSIIDTYKDLVATFSSPVTIKSYNEKFAEDGRFSVTFEYMETPYKTHFYVDDRPLHSSGSQQVLTGMTGKKVAVLLPSYRDYKQSVLLGKNGSYFATIAYDINIDLRMTLDSSGVPWRVTAGTATDAAANQKNLLNSYPTNPEKISFFDPRREYIETRHKELCEFFATPHKVENIGYYDNSTYVTLAGLPHTQIVVGTYQVEKGWFESIVQKYKPTLRVEHFCDIYAESFYWDYWRSSEYEKSIFGEDYMVPNIERFNAFSYMPEVTDQPVRAWVQLKNQGWNPLK